MNDEPHILPDHASGPTHVSTHPVSVSPRSDGREEELVKTVATAIALVNAPDPKAIDLFSKQPCWMDKRHEAIAAIEAMRAHAEGSKP